MPGYKKNKRGGKSKQGKKMKEGDKAAPQPFKCYTMSIDELKELNMMPRDYNADAAHTVSLNRWLGVPPGHIAFDHQLSYSGGKNYGASGATNVTLRAQTPDAIADAWTLPAYCCSTASPTIRMAIGEHPCVIQPRVAQALDIRDGDQIEIYFEEIGEYLNVPVKIMNTICSDVIIHDFIGLGMVESVKSYKGETWHLKSGRDFFLPRQFMFAGHKKHIYKGSARLYFDGASKNNPRGPTGYGYCIMEGHEGTGNTLVEGYGYAGMDRSSNEMEYEGLIEGLIWAMRLDLKGLTVCGDSKLIINQLTGKYSIKNHRLKKLNATVRVILQRSTELNVRFRHIPREQNTVSDGLANRAIETKKNATTVHWPNVNELMQ